MTTSALRPRPPAHSFHYLLRRFAILAFTAALLSGCTKQHLDGPVVGRGAVWALEVQKVRSGPNHFGYQNTNYVPARGTRFLWVVLRLSNLTAQDQQFSWSTCSLDRGIANILPSLVAVDTVINILKSEEERISANDSVGRKVAFSYPKGHLPTRLVCGGTTIPLDL